jgi:hypothetical protein
MHAPRLNKQFSFYKKKKERKKEKTEEATHRTSDALKKIRWSNVTVDQQVKH